MIDQLLEKFAKSTVLVIGDVMIDAYLKGSVGRISPEAPVPIVDVDERYYRPGGAANVAINLQSLGAHPLLCSVIGDDDKGVLFEHLMMEHGLQTDSLLRSAERKTTIKYRILANARQVLRVDEEDLHYLSDAESSALLQKVQEILDKQHVDAIIFEDYDKGVLSKNVISTIVAWAKARDIIVTVDPKKRNFSHYQGVTLFKPNLKELREGLEDTTKEFSMAQVEARMREFARANGMAYLFTTLSERGVALYDAQADEFFSEPAYLRKISDVSGAGDTVISVATLCILAGLTVRTAARISNLAGGIVCEYSGVTPIPAQQLSDEIEKNHILDSHTY